MLLICISTSREVQLAIYFDNCGFLNSLEVEHETKLAVMVLFVSIGRQVIDSDEQCASGAKEIN